MAEVNIMSGKNFIDDNKWLQYDDFRRNLRRLMDDKNMLGKDLAAAIDTTPTTISRYVRLEREPSIELVYRISRYFGCTIDYLLGISDSRYDTLTPQSREIAELYTHATEEDRAVVDALLKKYRKSKQ